ncbi:MAG: polysaccharide deacetylase family protein [Planctomycetaceae bacterium]|nr:polysaccharide deacetylase family protein [Planctomycetaceae bacterium]
MSVLRIVFASVILCSTFPLLGADGNRLNYLNGPLDPYYVHRDFARLATPQWVGETGVDAVVVLAIDDMRNPEKYESYLRPILNRLKQIDGRAPVSIMTNQVDPQSSLLSAWVQEGLSIEIHTIDHPCPLLHGGDFQKARQTYDQCVDLMTRIPGNHPVAFRMPCCDSMNTPSPRFWAEVFNKRTAAGNFLHIDSSVFNITTRADSELSAGITTDSSGRPRFRKYLPFPSFVNTIEDYPYPYVIGKTCWELPCAVPSDWEAQNLHQPNNPQTVTDMKRALDAVVQKQGVFDLVFHPHGWMRNDQVVELIDYSIEKYGSRVKYLTFGEVHDRLSENLMKGAELRDASGADAGLRMLDLNGDGWMDLLIPEADGFLTTRVWSPEAIEWRDSQDKLSLEHASFGVIEGNRASAISSDQQPLKIATYSEQGWRVKPVELVANSVSPSWQTRIKQPRNSLRTLLFDLDADGRCELLLQDGKASLILQIDSEGQWSPLPFGIPPQIDLPAWGGEAAWRLVDLNDDQGIDIVFADANREAVFIWQSKDRGWLRIMGRDRRQDKTNSERTSIPPLIRADGTNNGAWIHSKHIWLQNEDTDRLPDKVDRVSFDQLLRAKD